MTERYYDLAIAGKFAGIDSEASLNVTQKAIQTDGHWILPAALTVI